MTDNELEESFLEAVQKAANMTQADLPQDVQLRLYAYYKQATFGTIDNSSAGNFDLRNAFKTNAWMQISHLSIDEAKLMYIEIIKSLDSK